MRHDLLLVVLLQFALIAGQPSWMYSTMFGVTDKAILAPAINRNNPGKESLRFMLNYYKNLEANLTQPQAKKEALRKAKVDQIEGYTIFCGWPRLNQRAKRLYLPIRPQETSKPGQRINEEKKDVQRYRKEKSQFAITEPLVFKALASFGAALDKSQNIVEKTVLWKRVYHNRRENHTTETHTHTCQMFSNLAFRVENRWIIRALVTNDPPEAHRAKGKRFYLGEYLYLNSSDTVIAYPFNLNMSLGDTPKEFWVGRPVSPSPYLTRATTRMSRFGGRAEAHIPGAQFFEKNVAFLAALGDSKDLTRQALHAKSTSNIAILVFPIFMAAVPIALFADVSNAVALAYMILSDVITVLPLAIKGAELLVVGLKEVFSTRSVVYGNLDKNGTVAVATWSVRCISAQNLTAYGTAFVSAAIAAMILGIILEFVARAKVEKIKHDATAKKAFASLGVEYVWAKNGPCHECECVSQSTEGSRPGACQPSFGGGLIGQMKQRRKTAKQQVE